MIIHLFVLRDKVPEYYISLGRLDRKKTLSFEQSKPRQLARLGNKLDTEEYVADSSSTESSEANPSINSAFDND